LRLGLSRVVDWKKSSKRASDDPRRCADGWETAVAKRMKAATDGLQGEAMARPNGRVRIAARRGPRRCSAASAGRAPSRRSRAGCGRARSGGRRPRWHRRCSLRMQPCQAGQRRRQGPRRRSFSFPRNDLAEPDRRDRNNLGPRGTSAAPDGLCCWSCWRRPGSTPSDSWPASAATRRPSASSARRIAPCSSATRSTRSAPFAWDRARSPSSCGSTARRRRSSSSGCPSATARASARPPAPSRTRGAEPTLPSRAYPRGLPPWITRLPASTMPRPIQVVSGTRSPKSHRPAATLTTAKTPT